jgi:hypothetical protein
MRIDHVILATSSLEAAAARLEAEHGLRAVPGGRHVGMGTHNLIVPLGGGYLEVLAVADRAEAEGSELGRAALARIPAAGESWMGWAVATDDVAAVAERLGTPLIAIERDGLTARLAGLAEAMAEPALPFFIGRDEGIPDPGASGDAGGIDWIEVAGDARRLEEWLGDRPLPVRVVGGPPAVRAVGIGGRELRY